MLSCIQRPLALPLLLFLALVLGSHLLSPLGIGPRDARAAGLKIAIIEFKPLNEATKDDGLGPMIAESLTTAAVNTRSFEVVERHLLEKIMSEQAMGQRDMNFTTAAESIGKMVGADYLLSGSVIKTKNGQVRVEGRLVDVTSSQIVAAESFLSTEDLGQLGVEANKFMQRLRAKLGQPQGGAGPVGLAARFYFYSRNGLSIELRDEDAMTAEEGYYILLDLAKTSYVYAAQIDARGELYPIFPNSEFSAKANPLSAGKGFRLPAQDYFFLDENTGKERILVLASDGPLKDVDAIFAQAGSGGKGAKLAESFEQIFQKAPPLAKRSVWFWHK
jgi:TolB-like protein